MELRQLSTLKTSLTNHHFLHPHQTSDPIQPFHVLLYIDDKGHYATQRL